MQAKAATPETQALRPAETVMKLARLGAFHQCRLSFMRQLLRRLKRENWRFSRPLFDVDAKGVGRVVYEAAGPDRVYSLVCFAHDLPPEKRSDRVIAEAWDATFTLFDGRPDDADIARLERNVPYQEAGRISEKEICLSRANRSVRLFEHVVANLAAGQQPERAQIEAVGYLMRTTAVYGSGKFGAADRETLANRPELAAPFQAEMLTVFLIRAFTLDIVEHIAKSRNADAAVPLAPALRRRLGVGNSTGLGLAPFIINHPLLFNNWIAARETALARVRALKSCDDETRAAFQALARRAARNAEAWQSAHPLQIEKLAALRADLTRLVAHLGKEDLKEEYPWDSLYRWGEMKLSFEGLEQLVSLLLEPHGALVDDLGATMSADESACFTIDGAMPLSQLRQIAAEVYAFAQAIDWQVPESCARAWYVSEEKLEPRLGERFQEPIANYEQPLSPGRDAARMLASLDSWQGPDDVAAFLLQHPEHRHLVRRCQITAAAPYAEIRDNTIAAELLPIDLLRCKLSFFGATHFDPRSDRWVRINMFQNAPLPQDLASGPADDWSYPPLAEAST